MLYSTLEGLMIIFLYMPLKQNFLLFPTKCSSVISRILSQSCKYEQANEFVGRLIDGPYNGNKISVILQSLMSSSVSISFISYFYYSSINSSRRIQSYYSLSNLSPSSSTYFYNFSVSACNFANSNPLIFLPTISPLQMFNPFSDIRRLTILFHK